MLWGEITCSILFRLDSPFIYTDSQNAFNIIEAPAYYFCDFQIDCFIIHLILNIIDGLQVKGIFRDVKAK